MTFVAVVNLRVQAQLAESPDTAHSEEKLLLETVLPVTAIEVIGYLPVFLEIVLIVSVEKVKVCSSDFYKPKTGIDITSRESYPYGYPIALGIAYRLGRSLHEVLGIVFRNLCSLSGKHLGEIAVTVEKADSHKVHIHIRGLLEVVSCENTQTAGVNLEGSVKTVLHTEICHGRILALSFQRHILVKLRLDLAQTAEEFVILAECLEFLEANPVQKSNRVLTAALPKLRVY